MSPVTVYGAKSDSVWSILNSLERAKTPYIVVDNLGGADHRLKHLTREMGPSSGSVIIGPSMPHSRIATLNNALQAGANRFDALIDGSAVVHFAAEISHGCYLDTHVAIGALSSLGCFCSINRSTVISHHCRIGAFTTTGPGAAMCGGSSTDEGLFIGAGAVVLPKVHLGQGCVIGAGAVVTRDVPPGVVVTGNPARVIREVDQSAQNWSCPAC